jgi:hypothetical protein
VFSPLYMPMCLQAGFGAEYAVVGDRPVLLQVRGSPETGHEELVVITGPDQENSRPHGGMLPYLLDLTTFAWRHGNFRDPAAHVAVPAARQRPGKVKLAGQWLLVGEGTPVPVSQPALEGVPRGLRPHILGGSIPPSSATHLPTLHCIWIWIVCNVSSDVKIAFQVAMHLRPLIASLRLQIGTGGCLKDIHRLHLPTLTWRGPLPLHPASAAVQCGGGFTASGLVRFGTLCGVPMFMASGSTARA